VTTTTEPVATPPAEAARRARARSGRSPKQGGVLSGGVQRRASAPNMIVLVLFAVYFLFPIYWLIIAAFKEPSQLFSTNGFLPGSRFGFISNLEHVFTYQGSVYLYWLGDTLLYAVVGGALATLFAAVAGYGFAKYEFRGKGLAFGIIIGGVLVPVTALALPLYLLFDKLSLVNTIWSVLLPSLVSPFGVYLARIYAGRGIPNEIIDAARVDGAGEFGIFQKVGFPLMVPALVTIFLFQFVAIWNNFFLPLIMLNNPKLYPLALGLYSWNSSTTYAGAPPFLYSAVITGALVAVVPLVIAFTGNVISRSDSRDRKVKNKGNI
jgi:multiple sugar transport system permease protein